nr:nuclease-related domain-containing protein [Brachybacterium sacelli]
MLVGATIAATPVLLWEWVAIGRLPVPEEEPLSDPRQVAIPPDVIRGTTAETTFPPLAATRPDHEVLERLRQLRVLCRQSTAGDAELYAVSRVRQLALAPVREACRRRRRRQRLLEVIPVVAVTATAFLAPLLIGSSPWLLAVAIALPVVAVTVLGAFRVQLPGPRDAARDAAGYSAFTELGCVGANRVGQDVFGGAEKFGIAGERRTAELLGTWLSGMSRVGVFHSLRFPESSRADIDHVVVIGRELFVIDSKAWKGGEYRRGADDVIIAPDGSVRPSSMPAAAVLLGRAGWGDVRVVTVIHATSGEVSVTSSDDAGHMVLTPVELVQVLLEARDRTSRAPWGTGDAEMFDSHTAQLTATLVAAPARESTDRVLLTE